MSDPVLDPVTIVINNNGMGSPLSPARFPMALEWRRNLSKSVP